MMEEKVIQTAFEPTIREVAYNGRIHLMECKKALFNLRPLTIKTLKEIFENIDIDGDTYDYYAIMDGCEDEGLKWGDELFSETPHSQMIKEDIMATNYDPDCESEEIAYIKPWHIIEIRNSIQDYDPIDVNFMRLSFPTINFRDDADYLIRIDGEGFYRGESDLSGVIIGETPTEEEE